MRIKFIAFILGVLSTMAAFADEPVDSLHMPTGKTDWIDPVHATPVNSHYLLYPTPSRGNGTQGSCMVYLPDGYDSDISRRYPVIYYLHGGTGNQREAAWLIERIDRAVKEHRMNPVIVVSPQALPIGWYINANTNDPKVISGPIENVIVRDLIPFIDSNYRTVNEAHSRGIEGFSMGGRGALALAFGHPELFGAVSSVAGAVVEWDEEPLSRALECTFGDKDDPFSRIYFDSWHPKTFACQNASRIIGNGMKVRLFVGDHDRLYEENGVKITERFHYILNRLGINHSFTIVPGANHNPSEIFDDSINVYDVSFWDTAFSKSITTPEVPSQITDFVSTHFPSASMTDLTIKAEDKGDHYLLSLNDGSALKFNEHLNWIKVTNDMSGVPRTLIHSGIQNYLDTNDITCKVVRIEKIPRIGYDVTLATGETLTFDTKGKPINS